MDNEYGLRAWVLGGDGRYPAAVDALRDSGLPVRTYGVPGLADEAANLAEALRGAELVILPLRAFREDALQIGQESVPAALLPELLAREAILVGGWFPEEVEAWLRAQGIRCRSVLEVERYQIRNAAATAEAALGLAMEALDRTVFGAEALVIGWGRIGKSLAGKLRALGASVTVAARREKHLAEIETLGCRPEITGRYVHGLQYDLIVNTVPAPVLDARQGEAVKPDCVLLELASLPGGFPPELYGAREIIQAQGLPGRCVPKTAGWQLSEAVWDCLTGEGRALE